MASARNDPQKRALFLEKKVLRHNSVKAMVKLGSLLLKDDSFVSQRGRGVQMLERAIKQAQCPHAMYLLAQHFLGKGDKTEKCRAVSLLERSLKLEEHPNTAAELAGCYSDGNGVRKDYNRSVQMWERALRVREHPYLMMRLACDLLFAPQFRSQKKRAISLLKRTIRTYSYEKSLIILGWFYHVGTPNLSPCVQRASKWYRYAIRTSECLKPRYNFARLLLENAPNTEQVQQAVQLLEDAIEKGREQQRELEMIMKVAETYTEFGIESERALQLFEAAAIHFNSHQARSRVLQAWIGDLGYVFRDYDRILLFCLVDLKKNGDPGSLLVAVAMTWTGTNGTGMNREKAIQFLQSSCWTKHCLYSLMLRHDLTAHPHGRRGARRLLKKLDNRIDRSQLTIEEAVILSEKRSEDDRMLAVKFFRQKPAENEIAWLAPFMRRGRYRLPFDGHLDCVTKPVRRFAGWNLIASLNMASVLLEIDGKQQEVVTILEELMDTDLRLIAMLNLAFILINGVGGVMQDRRRGTQLLQDAVQETNDESARAMLANSLSERPDSDRFDVERGWELWRSVERDEENEDELHKIRRLVSRSSEERWRALASQRDRMQRERAARRRKRCGAGRRRRRSELKPEACHQSSLNGGPTCFK